MAETIKTQRVRKDIDLLASIACITYRHENYIKYTIEGLLMQETDFEFEINICDDCSPDNTRTIINEYIQNHSKGYRINYYRHDNNIGIMANGLFSLSKCKSKYIALCEGDDYWTDKNKLQKQVDFLEANPDYSLCFHNAIIKNERIQPFRETPFIQGLEKTTFVTEDIIAGWFIPTASIVFKQEGLTLPGWFNQVESGDVALLLLLSLLGKFKYLDETMSVWRLHPEGISAQHISYRKAIAMTFLYQSFNIHTNYKFDKKIKEEMEKDWHRYVIDELLKQREREILDMVHNRTMRERIQNLFKRTALNYKSKLFKKIN